MKDYKIISSISAQDLTHLVNEHIARGFVPLGGVAFAMNKWGQQYSQAMVIPTPKYSPTGPR
jgi:hypothetical protein